MQHAHINLSFEWLINMLYKLIILLLCINVRVYIKVHTYNVYVAYVCFEFKSNQILLSPSNLQFR